MEVFTLDEELKCSFNYFINHTNFTKDSTGYGMTLDNSSNLKMSSLAACGFMLTSLVIGVNEKLISFEEANEKAYLSIKSIYENIDEYKGLLVHFADFNTGKRVNNCEYSTIDTALYLAGVIVCSSFFKDNRIDNYLDKYLSRIDWNYYLTDYENKRVVRMAYNEYDWKTKEKYATEEEGYIFQWHMYAEQLLMYFMIASDDRVSSKDAIDLFNGFRRDTKQVGDSEFVRCPTGSLFTYQFSHCYFDFNKYHDSNDYNWFLNSKNACLDNYLFCKNNNKYETFKKGLWGVSASNGPDGYDGYGVPPYDYDETINYEPKLVDGTICPYSVIASLPFIPEVVEKTLEIMNSIPNLIGEYGYKDAVNLDRNWIADNYYGIDKGSSMIMIENYKNGLVWDLFTNHPLIQKAIKRMNFKKVGE